MGTYLITGFPGCIATSILRQLGKGGHPIKHVYLLTLPESISNAEEITRQIVREANQFKHKLTIIPGDITYPFMGLSEDHSQALQNQIEYVFHLAAIYDLSASAEMAYQGNVIGTKNVNEWVLTLPRLKRYVYFSTTSVSGTRKGRIYEHELEMNQSFRNHYEQTKFEAELLVRQLDRQLPTTIIRPGIMKGNSTIGSTIKFDGPYLMLNVFDRLRYLPWIPYVNHSQAIANFVPIDYVLQASLYLGHSPLGIGKTYHLTDPHPYTMHEIYEMMMNEYLGKKPKGNISLKALKNGLSIPPFRRWLRIEKEVMDYFSVEAIYDCTQTQQDLKGSGISLPDFKDTIRSIVHVYKQHKRNERKQLPIR
ncbi:SDR family oxidoreductase [Hazenella coriacea]|uniref:Thioester reductase-like protein n=1 Tax=Hazenella coriacea TaxID=1179467 RepID=A0A4V2UV86_9BACL|nr:SDR family oxidoreductase [Hazenella coriacea]TCS94807.1 thioester reductase-like protein [Hazenella coriacea]